MGSIQRGRADPIKEEAMSRYFHLLSNMEPTAVAHFWAACNIGKGDYLKLKEQLFAQESVGGLYYKIVEFQASKREA